MEKYVVPHFIGGEKIIADSENQRDIYNPALGEIIGKVNFADVKLCEQAIKTAKQAWLTWSQVTPIKRAQVLFKFRELLDKYKKDLAQLVTQEHGKTLADAQGSVLRAIEVVEYHCGLMMQLQGSYSANVSNGIDTYTLFQPLGVCVGVSPFNFPVMVPTWMIIPAIACGNTFIIKPSEQDPSATLRLIELLHEAKLPPGVVNCVQGDSTVVEKLITHPDVAAVTAVASTPVAKSIYTTAVTNGKRAHTFGGAKNHGVVMPDADFSQTASAIVGAAYGSAGERCMAISVVVTVGDQTAEQLLNHLNPLIHEIRIDIGTAENCDMGPVISKLHCQRILEVIDQGVQEGAKLIIDGRQYKHPHYQKGYFIGPTLFDKVTEEMSIYQKEIFGPVLVLVRVKTFDEAIELVNRNQYGNGTAIFTQNGYYAREYSQRVQVGMVGINIPIPVPVANHPFGGWKHSSFGNTNMHGMESIHFYTKRKTVTSRWLAVKDATNTFVMPNH